jgi:sulfur relay (sulfurtransferase) DsrC/TusE family protein
MIDLSANEMWKILDAITAYKKDYAVSVPVQKIIKDIEKKLKMELKK